MASVATGDSSLPPLIADRLARTGRIVVVATAVEDARIWAARLAVEAAVEVVVSASHNGIPVIDPRPDDLLIHGVPDVFGRVLPAPVAWSTVLVRDRLAAAAFPASGPIIEVGTVPAHNPNLVAGALRDMFKPICQQRLVKPVFSSPPPFGLPFIAPSGVRLPGTFGIAVPEQVPGLPDLVVVRPAGAPPPGTVALSSRAMMEPTSENASQEQQ